MWVEVVRVRRASVASDDRKMQGNVGNVRSYEIYAVCKYGVKCGMNGYECNQLPDIR